MMKSDERARITATGIAIVATMTSLGFWFTLAYLWVSNDLQEPLGKDGVLFTAFVAVLATAFTWAFARLIVR